MQWKEKLEGKIWFRFLKVVYIFCYTVSLIGVGIGAYLQIPRDQADTYFSEIRCDSGSVFNAFDNYIYPASEVLDSGDNQKAVQLCLKAGIKEKSPEQIVKDNIAGKKTTLTFE